MNHLKTQLSALPVVFLAMSFAVAQAQTKANFSGSWKLNAAKSDFGKTEGLSSLDLKIKHSDPELLVAQAVQGQTLEFKFSTDGKQCSNETPDGTMKTTLHWEGDVLVGTTDYVGNATFKDRWQLVDNGRTMRFARHISGPDGESDWSLVFDKQDEKK
jgi:hypothetical protein